MNITLKFQYPFTGIFPGDELRMELPENTTWEEACRNLIKEYPHCRGLFFQDSGAPNFIAVFDSLIAQPHSLLRDNSEVLLFCRADGG